MVLEAERQFLLDFIQLADAVATSNAHPTQTTVDIKNMFEVRVLLQGPPRIRLESPQPNIEESWEDPLLRDRWQVPHWIWFRRGSYWIQAPEVDTKGGDRLGQDVQAGLSYCASQRRCGSESPKAEERCPAGLDSCPQGAAGTSNSEAIYWIIS